MAKSNPTPEHREMNGHQFDEELEDDWLGTGATLCSKCGKTWAARYEPCKKKPSTPINTRRMR